MTTALKRATPRRVRIRSTAGPRDERLADESVGRALIRGLTQPSAASLVMTCTVASALCLAAFHGLNETWMIRHGMLLAAGPHDVHVAVTRRALEIRMAAPASNRVLLLGNLASDRLCDEDALSQQIGAAAGADLNVADLRTPHQTLWETLALVDQTPRGSAGAAVLAISPAALLAGADVLAALDEHPMLGLRSPSYYIELHLAGIATPPLLYNYFFDNHAFLFNRGWIAASNLWKSPDGSAQQSAPTMEAPEHPLLSAIAEGRVGTAHLDNNLEALKRVLVRLGQGRRLRPILMVDAAWDGTADAVIPRLKTFAQEHDVALLTVDSAQDDLFNSASAREAVVREIALVFEEAR